MLKSVVDAEAFESMDASLQEHYKEGPNSTYVLDAEVKSHPEVERLSNALTAEREGNKKLSMLAKELKGMGIEDLDNLYEKVKKANELERKYDLETGNYEKVLKESETKFEQRIAEMSQERDALVGQIRQYKITDAAHAAIAKYKGKPELLMPHIREVADLGEDGQVIIKDKDGKPMMKKGWKSADDLAGIEDYVVTLRDDKIWGAAFEGAGTTGGGATPTSKTKSTAGGKFIQKDDGSLIYTQ